MKLEWKNLWKAGAIVFVFCLAWKYFYLVQHLITTVIGAMMPLFAGAIIAFFINIVMSAYEKWLFKKCRKKGILRFKRAISLFLALITILALLSLIVTIVVPQLVDCLELIVNLFPKAARWVIGKLDNVEVVPQTIIDLLVNIDWKSQIGKIVNVVTTGIGDTMQIVFSTLTTVVSGIVTALLSIIFAVYLLVSKNKIADQVGRVITVYLPEKIHSKIFYVYKVFSQTFRRYFVGQCTEALILGILCIIGMLILGLPYASMIGTLVAFTALIPVAGAYIGAVIGALMIVTDSPAKALVFIIFLVVLQQIEGNLIYPKVVGSSIGLPGIWVLAAVTVGGSVAGISGMLLGVPLVAGIYTIVKNDMAKRSQREETVAEVETDKEDTEEKSDGE